MGVFDKIASGVKGTCSICGKDNLNRRYTNLKYPVCEHKELVKAMPL